MAERGIPNNADSHMAHFESMDQEMAKLLFYQ